MWTNQATIAAGRENSPNNKRQPADSKATQATVSTVSSLMLRLRPTATSQPNVGIKGLSKAAMASPTSRPTRPLPLLANRYCQSLLKNSAYTITCRPKPLRSTASHVSVSGGNKKPMKRCQNFRSGLSPTLICEPGDLTTDCTD